MSIIRTWKKAYEQDLANIVIELKEVVGPPAIIVLDGPVGAGKTTFSKLFMDSSDTSSPTYSIVNEFNNILHADLYRIEKKDELIHLELPMYLEEKDYFLVEWGIPYTYELKKIVNDEFVFYCLKIEIVDTNLRNFYLSKI